MYVWVARFSETWSSFAPNFKELESNEVYIEREDEFDIIDEAILKQRRKGQNDLNMEEKVEILNNNNANSQGGKHNNENNEINNNNNNNNPNQNNEQNVNFLPVRLTGIDDLEFRDDIIKN